jgi:hypothetical protein
MESSANPLRIGLLGSGFIARFHLQTLALLCEELETYVPPVARGEWRP